MATKVLFLAAILFLIVLEIRGNQPPCTSDHFPCLNHKCITRSYFCDNDNDCGDRSDENYCNKDPPYAFCPDSWMKCSTSYKCYPKEWNCDGIQDCIDNSDELECVSGRDPFRTVSAAKYKNYFLEKRKSTNSINKWGLQLPKVAISLFFMDRNYFAPGNTTGEEISYELSLQMMSKLALKRKISTQKLALYINALIVACIDPRNFFGVDMVAELRSRVVDSNITNPFTYLTLCNARDPMKPTDVLKLKSVFEVHRRPLWTDTQALTTMAMACISSHSNVRVDDEILNTMVADLKKKQHRNATIGNLRSTALVLQALIATGRPLNDFNFAGAGNFLLQQLNTSNVSFSDIYYVLPILNGMSLTNINSSHCSVSKKTELDILNKFRENVEDRIQAKVSVYIEDHMDVIRSWNLKVPNNYSFYQVLEKISILDPKYKVEYGVTEDKKPYVIGLAKHFDDAENGIFWFIYSRNLQDTSNLTLVEKSPVDISLKENEELILWYRSGTWTDFSITSTNFPVTPTNSLTTEEFDYSSKVTEESSSEEDKTITFYE